MADLLRTIFIIWNLMCMLLSHISNVNGGSIYFILISLKFMLLY